MKNSHPTSHLPPLARLSTRYALAVFAALFLCFQTYGQGSTHLISSEYLGHASKEAIALLSPLPANFDVDFYKITYWTIGIVGDSTMATGAVVMPAGESCNTFPLVVYCHRTVLEKFNVPSNRNDESGLATALASAGFITVAPDYLGLGENPGLHPYLHAESEATATIDAVRAANEFLPTSNLNANGEFFLTGYGQGGHAAMAVAKYIAANGLQDEFNVTAAAPMSGAYNLSGAQTQQLLDDAVYSSPGFVVYLISSYEMVYGNLYDQLSDIVKAPYDAIIPIYFDGIQDQYDMLFVNSQFPVILNELFVDTFVTNLAQNMNHPLRVDLAANDNYNWTPQIPMRLYYCGADQKVAPLNSTSAATSMTENGALDVQAIDVSAEGTHTTCIEPAAVAMYQFFDSLSVGCSFVTTIKESAGSVNISLYPNPATDQLKVRLGRESGTLSLYSTDGRRAKQVVLQGGETIFDLTAISAGAYVAVVTAGDQWHREVVIVVK